MRILRLKEVISKTGISRSSIYRPEKEGLFPQHVSVTPYLTSWVESEIDDYLEKIVAESRCES